MFLLAASLAVAAALALALGRYPPIREPPPLPSPEAMNELVVLVLPGPILYFPGPGGTMVGFDADLVRLYAAATKLPLRFVTVESPAELLAAIAKGHAHIGAGGLFRPPPGTDRQRHRPRAAVATDETRANVQWTTGVFAVEPVVIYNRDGFRPASWIDLEGETVAYIDGSGLDSEIDAIRAAHPGVKWQPVSFPSPAGLIAQVSDGTVGYAIVGSLAASIARNIYLDFDVAFRVGGRREIAWAVPARFPAAARGPRHVPRTRAPRRDARPAHRTLRAGSAAVPARRRRTGSRSAWTRCCRNCARSSTRRRRRRASSGACSRRWLSRNPSGTPRPPAKPVCAG